MDKEHVVFCSLFPYFRVWGGPGALFSRVLGSLGALFGALGRSLEALGVPGMRPWEGRGQPAGSVLDSGAPGNPFGVVWACIGTDFGVFPVTANVPW